ncbi:saccharopine dehydrogenase [Kordiimonas marina]|uniref:saccharopine dehydrogenase n=1 Tax=Kordiimonas marina TaxID=2872312 RepID=UPI001FF0FC5D|nr:saccharopine dehydrogenase [Kordiimonas marina]MCJ9428016.1 saccharopine dehydrogenase [Kordiimonas marina]
MKKLTLWLRDEARATERRTPLLPDGAKKLIDAGIRVVVEKSQKRIFADALYEDAGCTMSEPGAWLQAPKDAVILGLKELPSEPQTLMHRHIYFAHAYKEQAGWQALLDRFLHGGGALFDIEYMTEPNGRRVAAFGYWAGYMGAALALMQWYDREAGRASLIGEGLTPFESADALDALIKSRKADGAAPKALVIGASGRSGTGAVEILERHGIEVTRWGRKETADIDRNAILDHDILVNCTFVDHMIPPFLTKDHFKPGARLNVISDVSCDPFSDFNPLPLYSEPTRWKSPALEVETGTGTLDLIAIDNLPSLLPTEASIEFAGMIFPYLKTLADWHNDPVWVACDAAYQKACAAMTERKAS